jgi:TonB-linked SusC/RagA family outer membrane protein
MKKKCIKACGYYGCIRKLLFVMKLTVLLFFMGLMSLSASTYSQTKKITLDLENVSVLEVFNQIESQSEFVFIYKNEAIDLNQKVNLKVENSTVDKILKSVLQQSGAVFQIVDKQIIITPDHAIPSTNSNIKTIEENLPQPQKIDVSGKVKDTKNLPLPGVSIIVKGTTIGTITDSEGQFKLSIPVGSKTLLFSFVGMKSQEKPIATTTTFNIVMEEETVGVEEVVVTALGIEKSVKSLTYSTQQVNMDGLMTNKDINLGNALTSKVAGVSITSSSGASGVSGDALIVIRGNRSITNGNQPLIVVDGIPLSTGGGGLSGINADDVQSMNVLKGPAASALYGSAANNGVIVVTTKKGKKGEARVEFNSSTMFDLPYLYPEFQNEYAQGADGKYNSTTEYLSWGPKMTGQTVTNWTGDEIKLTSQPNNVKDFFQTGYDLVNSFSYSVGDDKMNAYFSYTNTTAQGILADNKMQRHNVNLRIDGEMLKNLKMDFKVTYNNKEVKDQPVTGDDLFSPMFNLIKMPRSIRTADIEKYSYIDATGSMQQNSWFPASTNNVNPYWSMYGYENPSSGNNVNSLISLRYDFASWLYLQIRGSLSSGSSDYEQKTYWDTPYIYAGHGNYVTQFAKGRTYDSDVLLSFNKKIGKNFNLGLNVGAEINDNKSRSMKSDAQGLNTENKFSLAYAEKPVTTDSESRIQKQSVYGMGQLSFRNYLFLDATARNDWSSTLPSPYDYFYPSVGLTGVVSDMVKLPDFVTFAKLRGSYAEVGNDAGWAQTLQTYTAEAKGPAGIIYPKSTRMPVNLIPEKSKSWEAGADLRFFKNRLSLDLTWYKSNTYNQLVKITSVATSGYSDAWKNCGNIQNTGVEIMLSATPIEKPNFSWDLNLNFTKNKNKVIELDKNLEAYKIDSPNLSVGESWILKGRPYGELYTKGFVRDANGNVIVDALGMPKIDATENPTPSKYLGNFNYDWSSSITNSFQYKNWNMSFLIDLNYGGVRGSSTEAMMLLCGTSKASLVGREDGILIDGVFADGTKNNVRINAEAYYRSVGGRISNGCGELFSHDATNSRLRELSIGYTIPLKSNVVKSLKVSATGRNLFYIYNGCKWFDPDVTYDTTKNGQGSESAFLPGSRTLGFNIKLTL